MTWFEKLYENPSFLAKFARQLSESYSWYDNKFCLCISDLPIFEELGLRQSLGCPCYAPMLESVGASESVENNSCCKCDSRFLFDPLIYELSIKEFKKDG